MRHLAALTAAASSLLLLAAAACSVASDTDAPQDLTGSNYSLTQTITNNSALDLSVRSVTADNGGIVAPGAPTTITAGTPATFTATNVGNGVQLTITLTGTDGQVVVVDSDVPRVNSNWTKATISGTGGGLGAGPISIGEHDTPTATFTLESCAPDARCTTSASYPGGPVTVKATP